MTRALLHVAEVDADRLDFDEHLAAAGSWILHILEAENLGPAVTFEPDRAHGAGVGKARYARWVQMSDPRHEVHELDTRLIEIDRKLREIQAELAQPESVLAPEPEDEPPPEPTEARGRSGPLADVLQHAPRFPQVVEDRLTRRIEELAGLQADLLVALRNVLAEFEQTTAKLPRARGGELTVSAGPFTSTEAVRAFERELAGLPGVRAVALRGYEGVDRAVIDVQLA